MITRGGGSFGTPSSPGADLPADLAAVDVRQAQVEADEIVGRGRQALARGGGVVDDVHCVSLAAQAHLQRRREVGLVFDDQQAHWSPSRMDGRRW